MIDQRERYERAFARFEPPQDALERFLTYRGRRHQRRQVIAGVVGITVFVAAVLLVTSSPADRSEVPAGIGSTAVTGPTVSPDPTQGRSIGLPPEGAHPSSPERGELVLTYYGRPEFGVLQVLVYADGRVIWREEYGATGANGIRTGFLEQRLTPAGVELLRSEVISSGLFDRDHNFDAGLNVPGGDEHGLIWGEIRVDDGDGFVSVGWGPLGGPPTNDGPTTPAQATALVRLNDVFLDPASVLPASAWEDPDVKAYVPSRYAICYREAAGWHPADVIEPSEVVNHLPTQAGDLLLGRDRTYEPYSAINGGGRREICSEVTTEEARLLEEILVDAGSERVRTGLTEAPEYGVPAPPPIERAFIRFEPILPHGHWSPFPG